MDWKKNWWRRITLAIILFVGLLDVCSAYGANSEPVLVKTPESGTAALFLQISPSVRVNGMGQAGVALADEPGGRYNPGAAALSYPGTTFQSQFYLGKMPWLQAFVNDIYYNYYSAQASTSRIFDGLSWKGPTSLGATLYGYRVRLDLGQSPIHDDYNQVIGTYHYLDEASNFGISLALRSMIDLGVGATAKRIYTFTGESERVRAMAYDFGLIVVLPVVGAFERITGREIVWVRYLRPQLDIGFGVAWHNRGAPITDKSYPGGPVSFPLPASREHGWSTSLGMDWSNDSIRLTLGKLIFTGVTYRPQIKGAKVTDAANDDQGGAEVSFMETISIRRGEYDDFDGSVHLKTSGVTINSAGSFKLMAHALSSLSASTTTRGLQLLFRHLSVSWSHYEYTAVKEWSPLDSTDHSFLSLSLCLRDCEI